MGCVKELWSKEEYEEEENEERKRRMKRRRRRSKRRKRRRIRRRGEGSNFWAEWRFVRGKSSDGLSTKNHLSSPHTPGYTYNCKHKLYKTINILSNVFTAQHQGWAGIPVPVHSQEWKPLIPFPELWEWIFSFPSRSRILGMFFSFPSRSRIMGMGFFHSLPVPKLWEWIFFIPFPFPNFGNRVFHSLPIPGITPIFNEGHPLLEAHLPTYITYWTSQSISLRPSSTRVNMFTTYLNQKAKRNNWKIKGQSLQ